MVSCHMIQAVLRRLEPGDNVWKKLCVLSASQKEFLRENLVGCILDAVEVNSQISQSPIALLSASAEAQEVVRNRVVLFNKVLGISGIAIKMSSYLEANMQSQSRLCQMLLFGLRAKYRPSWSLFGQSIEAANCSQVVEQPNKRQRTS